jgi:hypothetical protein
MSLNSGSLRHTIGYYAKTGIERVTSLADDTVVESEAQMLSHLLPEFLSSSKKGQSRNILAKPKAKKTNEESPRASFAEVLARSPVAAPKKVDVSSQANVVSFSADSKPKGAPDTSEEDSLEDTEYPLKLTADGKLVDSLEKPNLGPKKAKGSEPLKPKRKPAKPPIKELSAAAQAALKEIGGILTVLTAEERFAILKKVNGAFGYKPKATVEVPNDQPRRKKTTLKKNSFNESFSKTLEGYLFESTKKTLKKLAQSKDRKPDDMFFKLHYWLVDKRKIAKSDPGKTLPVESFPQSVDSPDTAVDLLLSGSKVITKAFEDAGEEEPSPDLIFKTGMCLIQGTVPPSLPTSVRFDPNPKTWPIARRSVPRTVEEAEKRARDLLASKEQRKLRKKKSDSQTSSRKRTRTSVEATENPTAPIQKDSTEGMEVEAISDS